MKERYLLIWNTVIFVIFSFLVAGMQTTFWPLLARFFEGMNLWIYLLVYASLYRPFWHGLLFVYLNTIALHAFTNSTIGILLLSQIIILLFCHFFRSRIFWNTLSYFMIMSAAAILLFEISLMLLSRFFEFSPATSFPWWKMFISIIVSPLFSFLFFRTARIIDGFLPPQQPGAMKS